MLKIKVKKLSKDGHTPIVESLSLENHLKSLNNFKFNPTFDVFINIFPKCQHITRNIRKSEGKFIENTENVENVKILKM